MPSRRKKPRNQVWPFSLLRACNCSITVVLLPFSCRMPGGYDLPRLTSCYSLQPSRRVELIQPAGSNESRNSDKYRVFRVFVCPHQVLPCPSPRKNQYITSFMRFFSPLNSFDIYSSTAS
ncbi:hypothetical protein BT96DRAFT_10921 [Gymnopus androsaceus JB14]|uniref:Uncharacterized protein n=1 Tax=Gymnopus androsaceus JB14 TaxID=1447944 RepID=A0A6A4ILP8_9AGAR|nr:hypothetical protein BT96DRAFT_10921 [Gymnopus androsaceus JB14]